MFRYPKIIYNYVKLFACISYINYRKIDISNNIEWINTIKNIRNKYNKKINRNKYNIQ